MATTTNTPKIAIIGAGPVGLTLAAILHRNGIRSTVFERETSAAVRAQGGTLDIHADAGQRALVAAGLLGEFRKRAREEGEAMRLLRGDGTVVLDEDVEQVPSSQKEKRGGGKEEKGGKGEGEKEGEEEARGRPEIDRRDLKDLLIAALPRGYVRWGKGVKSITAVPGTAQWMLDFIGEDNENDHDDDESGPYDLVLGADGAWSRVRPLLTDVRPLYSGIISLDIWISAEQLKNRPDIANFIGKGTCMIISEGRSMALQRHSDGSARAYVDVQTHKHVGGEVPSAKELLKFSEEESEKLGEERGGEVDWTDEKTRKRFLDTHFGDWAQEPIDVATAMTERPTLRPLYMLPVGHRWEGRPGVSLLGDAAHLMTPFAGAGVNVGMVDALELAEGIVGYVNGGEKGADELARVLRRYEEGMFERSSRDAAFTAQMMVISHEDGGAERLRDIVTGGGLDE
ncbi:FAD/NAD(P)-binding domain-containing protein [Annulohypoxylon truncatum]|uniref:FAD/NAD(P)-binding domain-containing protein n=1 Tax=Annulohypoxylon truncatum TaxID=327061 RepID=UPI0020085E97|nr:FAD/NAD(P)-binding domain-containing protein [Annulohypoxylon truncatum]KAI1204153.1 FAD/NAD(P)-binding domain-containing protein [Annulohypoxylon truncatum]